MTVIDLQGKHVKLADLVKQDEVSVPSIYSGQEAISRLVFNSNDVEQGDVFLALPPLDPSQSGAEYIAQALKRKAKIILKESTVILSKAPKDALVIDIKNARHLKAMMAHRLFRKQPKTIVGVTGTNGKTSVAEFSRQFWELMGIKAASLGTLGIRSATPLKGLPDISHTSPDPFDLHKALEAMQEQHIECLAIEASSHGLDQHRLDGVEFSSCGFTSLSHDHLDYHKDMDTYFAAKERLFRELMSVGETAVLNADTTYFSSLSEACQNRGLKVLPYGKRAEKGIQLLDLTIQEGKQVAFLSVDQHQYTVDLNFIGKFQVLNVLCAMGLLMATGVSARDLVPLLSKLKPIPGRLELMGTTGTGGSVYVDYAHTPDGLSETLLSLRPYVGGILCVVFGCGGDRDKEKRPIMGQIAAQYSDAQIVTDDNPRSEDPKEIRHAILKLCNNPLEISDRAEAITRGIKRLTKHDACLIAGKGHETVQIVGKKHIPFDDRALARQIILETGGVLAHE
jgi:UDP-N-acetylmuramoyl-L-alanyl-D-glutamate--2,6-diaminopimelate ligase